VGTRADCGTVSIAFFQFSLSIQLLRAPWCFKVIGVLGLLQAKHLTFTGKASKVTKLISHLTIMEAVKR